MSGREFKTDSEVKTSSKYDSRREYKAYREGYFKSDLSSMDGSDVDSMIDDMSFRELRVLKKLRELGLLRKVLCRLKLIWKFLRKELKD